MQLERFAVTTGGMHLAVLPRLFSTGDPVPGGLMHVVWHQPLIDQLANDRPRNTTFNEQMEEFEAAIFMFPFSRSDPRSSCFGNKFS